MISERNKARVDRIFEAVEFVTGVPRRSIEGPGRHIETVEARCYVIHAIRSQIPEWSQAKIAEMVSRKDPGTVGHALRETIPALMEKKHFQNGIKEVHDKLRELTLETYKPRSVTWPTLKEVEEHREKESTDRQVGEEEPTLDRVLRYFMKETMKATIDGDQQRAYETANHGGNLEAALEQFRKENQ